MLDAKLRLLVWGALLVGACSPEQSVIDAGVDASARAEGGSLDADTADDAGPMLDAATADASAGDAAPSWPDAGLPPPPWVELTVGPAGGCVPFVACGGDVVGTWDTHGGCFEIDLEPTLEACPGAAVTRRSGRGRGRVVFGADGFGHRVAEAVVEVEVFFPALCAAVFSCEMLEAAMARAVTEASCAPDGDGNCDCLARELVRIDQRDAYRTESNEIVSISSGKRWEYCVEGDRLDYRDTSPSGPREPGSVELIRR